MIRINDIVDKVSDYLPDADLDIIERAYIYSARVHEGQVRLSGEPYLSHPLEVAGILADMKLDPESVTAGLLHDVKTLPPRLKKSKRCLVRKYCILYPAFQSSAACPLALPRPVRLKAFEKCF